MASLLTLVLAAGKGTRMKSNLSKVLHKLAGKPLIKHVLTKIDDISAKTIVIVGYQASMVKEELDDMNIEFAIQKEQLGTGHAVLQARDFIKEHSGPVLILYGDTPLLSKNTINDMINSHKTNKAALTILTAKLEDASSYGRIIRNNDLIDKIVEEKDADEEIKKIKEVNSGVYCFNGELLNEALDHLNNNNSQGEYYLTDVVTYLNEKGEKVIPYLLKDEKEIIGINDRVNLARAEKIIRNEINERHMKNGVTIIDPDTTYIDDEFVIEKDTIVYPFTYLEGSTNIGKSCIIGPHSRLVNAEIANNINVKSNCVILESAIENDCNIGPFAYIRPGTYISKGAKIGNFVELKKAKIGENSKVPHLTYVGDAEIGNATNIGAGTIFANYDGVNKNKTYVGNNAFVGSNTTLVAPVNLKDGVKTGAGSVVTRDVDKDTIVFGVPARFHKKVKKD